MHCWRWYITSKPEAARRRNVFLLARNSSPRLNVFYNLGCSNFSCRTLVCVGVSMVSMHDGVISATRPLLSISHYRVSLFYVIWWWRKLGHLIIATGFFILIWWKVIFVRFLVLVLNFTSIEVAWDDLTRIVTQKCLIWKFLNPCCTKQ